MTRLGMLALNGYGSRVVRSCRNLPFGGRATRDSRVRVPRKEYVRSRHQRLFEENVGKIEKDMVYELQVKGSGVVFMHGEGISTPHIRHKRRQPLIKCANMTSIYIIFPFYVLMSFLCLLCFYLFVLDKGVSLCSYVFLNCDEKIRPT